MKTDVYQEVTNQVVEMMETAGANWIKPFEALAGGMPMNATTGNEYRGINVLLLAMAGGQHWASFKQWQTKGAQVRKGEKGTRIVFFKMLERENAKGGAPAAPERPVSAVEAIAAADAWVEATGAEVRFNDHGRCFYSPGQDFISMSQPSSFTATPTSTQSELYYATLLHELTHWTGSEHRLARTNGKRFGDDAYAMEELVAELGAAMQCVMLGVTNEPREDHAHYLNGWLTALKGDKRLIFTAAAEAQKACDFIRLAVDVRQTVQSAAQAA
jgi:antirestriction protein ArdC